MKPMRLSLLLFALPAVLIALLPGWPAALVLDRAALAHGDWWRLWTGHWVHFSPSHLAWNLAVVLVAGTWLARVRPGRLIAFTLIAPPLISAAVLVCEPHLLSYGGLSGLATGLAALLALTELERSRRDAAFWGVFLGLIAAKSVLDGATVMPLFSRFATPGVQASTAAHLAGLGTALLFCAPACTVAISRRWRLIAARPQSNPPDRHSPPRARVAPACDPACRQS